MPGIVAEWFGCRRASARSPAIIVRLLVACGLVAPVSGCYVMQAASGQAEVMARSRPIPEVLADPATPPATRSRIELASEARDFAVRELALPDSGSYATYADLGRPYALWNVVATPEFSLQSVRWCFPVAGCVTYRGYFSEPDAKAMAWKLAARGEDTAVEGVATYSTLGHFPDPLLSTMLGWRDTRLVGTIFHELAHERLYVPGDSEFNEAFATVVEEAGIRLWLAARAGEREIAAYDTSKRREAEFVALLREARKGLAKLYSSELPAADMRIEKNREFGRLKFDYQALKAGWGGYSGYDTWFARPINNARLASVATYHDCVPGLERELSAAGSLPAFYARADELAKLSRDARRAVVCGAPPER